MKSTDKIYDKHFIQLINENKWLRAICQKEIVVGNKIVQNNSNKTNNTTKKGNKFDSPVKDKGDDIIYRIEADLTFKIPKNKDQKGKKMLNDTINFKGRNNTDTKTQETPDTADFDHDKNDTDDVENDEMPSKDSESSVVLIDRIKNENDENVNSNLKIINTGNKINNPESKKLQKLSLYKTTPRLYLFHKNSQAN